MRISTFFAIIAFYVFLRGLFPGLQFWEYVLLFLLVAALDAFIVMVTDTHK